MTHSPFTPEQENTLVRALTKMVDEMDRLKALSTKDLILECLGSPAADSLIVTEMMDRLLPGWVDLVNTEVKGG